MNVSDNAVRWALGDDQRLNIHAYPTSNVGAAIDRLMHVGFTVTNGYQDGVVRMARAHADGGETFCFIGRDGRVGPMLTWEHVKRDMAKRNPIEDTVVHQDDNRHTLYVPKEDANGR